jgi:ubiquinol-cytochrome c reductase iron-sulfur subunit
VKRLWRAAVLLVALAFRRREPKPEPEPRPERPSLEEGTPFAREVGADPRAEALAAGLLLASAVASTAFVVVLLVSADTQLLGLSLGLALLLLGAALGVTANRIVPREHAIEERPQLADPEARGEVDERLAMITEGVSRRGLLGAAGLTAGAALAAAATAPVTALGPSVGDSIVDTPWRRGRRLVGEDGRTLSADDVPRDSFVTAFPEGADKRELGSPVVLVREDPASLQLPRGREGWAPDGILAFSKICTHAGCAVALYRAPLYEPTSQPPGLACPCHYSVFDARTGGTVVSGPAGRPLPQLPLEIGADGVLRAAGGFSGPIGPAWWGVRKA